MRGHFGLGVWFSSLLLVFCLCANANALVLTLEDSLGNTQTVVENAGSPGGVTYFGSLGGWTWNVSSGISDPVLGTPTLPHLDLASQNISGGSGTMTITLEDTFGSLDPGITAFFSILGGATNGSVTFNYYLNNALQTTFSSNGPNFSDQQLFNYFPEASNTFMIEAIITHSMAGQVTSFNAELVPVPEPGTLMLLGFGRVGLAWAVRQRRA